MMKPRHVCPTKVELSRALSGAEELPAALAGHLLVCPACHDERQGIQRLRKLARALPYPSAPPDQLEAIRASLLVAKPPRRALVPARPRRWGLLVVAAVATALLAVETGRWSMRLHWSEAPVAPAATTRHTIVSTGLGAHYEALSSSPDELVRLREGSITLEVSPLRSGERFRVIVGDAEIEVKGTLFEVCAKDDRLVSVRVYRGRVEVRPAGRPERTLLPNEEWTVTLAAQSAPAPASGPSPLRRKDVVHRHVALARLQPTPKVRDEAPKVVETADGAFEQAWALLRDNDFEGAIAPLERALSLAGRAPIAEDAAFWIGVCQVKTNNQRKARATFTRFLREYQGSPRAGEAAALLGWTLLALGKLPEARLRFSEAQHDASARVRDSAQLGMAALARAAPEPAPAVP